MGLGKPRHRWNWTRQRMLKTTRRILQVCRSEKLGQGELNSSAKWKRRTGHNRYGEGCDTLWVLCLIHHWWMKLQFPWGTLWHTAEDSPDANTLLACSIKLSEWLNLLSMDTFHEKLHFSTWSLPQRDIIPQKLVQATKYWKYFYMCHAWICNEKVSQS